jgi:hypothetical protein
MGTDAGVPENAREINSFGAVGNVFEKKGAAVEN